MVFDLISRGEEITITYRGKAKAKLTPCDESDTAQKSDAIFGMWSDRADDVDTMVRDMRKGRSFEL